MLVLEQVQQLLKDQIDRNSSTIAAFGNIRLVTEQLSAASRKQSLTSGELSQKTDGVSNQLTALTNSMAKHTANASQVAGLISGDGDGAITGGRERQRLGELLGELEALAGYLREDFDKLTRKRL